MRKIQIQHSNSAPLAFAPRLVSKSEFPDSPGAGYDVTYIGIIQNLIFNMTGPNLRVAKLREPPLNQWCINKDPSHLIIVLQSSSHNQVV